MKVPKAGKARLLVRRLMVYVGCVLGVFMYFYFETEIITNSHVKETLLSLGTQRNVLLSPV